MLKYTLSLSLTLITSAATAQSEAKSFLSPPSSSKLEACGAANSAAQAWVRQNTGAPNEAARQMNQVRRGWAAQPGRTSPCDCEKNGDSWKCAVDAEIVAR